VAVLESASAAEQVLALGSVLESAEVLGSVLGVEWELGLGSVSVSELEGVLE